MPCVCRCPEYVVNTLKATSKNVIHQDGIQATRLCTHKEDVEEINKHHLHKLIGDTVWVPIQHTVARNKCCCCILLYLHVIKSKKLYLNKINNIFCVTLANHIFFLICEIKLIFNSIRL